MSSPGATNLDMDAARKVGMTVAVTAREHPGRHAIRSPLGDRSFEELNARANQLARALRKAGLKAGDAVALLCANRPEFAEVFSGLLRSGLRLTAINWHLQSEEVAYIVENCEARAFIADTRFADVAAAVAKETENAGVRLAVAGPIDGFDSYDRVLAQQDGSDIDDPELGGTMLYTSGTTGRPKGVYRREPPPVTGLAISAAQTAAYDGAKDTCLCTGPLYHAAPLAFNLAGPLAGGVGVSLMDRWDPEETLRLTQEHGATHTHMVATMFHRLLALPEEVRERYDISSMRYVLHGAAPTPVHVKKALIDWFGPVVFEYYAATEGGGTFIDSHEWLNKPGSVGQPASGQLVEIRDDDGNPLPSGDVGTVYFRAPGYGRFEYFKDPEKTSSSYAGDFFTMKDMGYLDEDGYLFLTGRTSELIISGGVNIYPSEVDDVLLEHPAVADVATVGVPNEEFGEEVKAVVQPVDGRAASHALADELIQHCRSKLAHYKCPRSVDFDAEIPRSAAGKVQRRVIRDRYWQGRERQI